MSRQISDERKAAYYIGMGLTVVGALLFFSVFVSGAMNFGNFDNFDQRGRSMAARAVSGMALLIVGAVIRGIGAQGVAGSGVVIDPEKARRDLEPYSRMRGGMIKDALDEADIHLGGGAREPEKVIMVRCTACGKLNEEDSKFCQECGKKI
jgi:hypothetical protein